MATKGYPVYDISGFDVRQSDVLVMPLAPYMAIHQQKLAVPHRHSFYHAVYFIGGLGNHYIDFDRFAVEPGQLYFMAPGQVHRWAFQQGEAEGFVVNFSASFFQSFLFRPDYIASFSFFQGRAQDSVMVVPAAIRPKVEATLLEMVGLRASITPVNLDKLRVLILQLLLHAADLHPARAGSGTPYKHTVLRNFQSLVNKHFIEWRHPKDYAEALYITPNHLNALCADVLGLSAGEVIRNRVTLEAKRLLVNQELTITTIAYQLNFKDNSYFSKFFKKHAGVTPEAFRKEALRS